MEDGTSTMNARTVYESTETLPNHTSMITGRPVTTRGGHAVTFNDDDGSTVHEAADGYCASIFDVVHDTGGSTALYAGKEKFDFLDRNWDDGHGAADTTGRDDGRDKIDTYVRADGTETTEALRKALTSDPADFSMIHFAGPDQVGHDEGFMSAEYLSEVSETDELIGDILSTITTAEELATSTVVIVTSDHGGVGESHGAADQAMNYTVPFFAWGPGVAAGADLYELNPDRSDPGTGRPNYSESGGPVRNAEVGNLVAELLGLGAIPGSRINADQSLDVVPG
jgi:predicted AlkP superfamily pyrophosphatase or phosphodiesterase